MKINDIPDDMTQEQFMEGMVRLELYNESRKRLWDWLNFHNKLFEADERRPMVIVFAAVQMLTEMLVGTLNLIGVQPTQAAEEIARRLAERYEEEGEIK